MRTFLQNKLWRDKSIAPLEKSGSIIDWHRLDDQEFDKQLRLKMVEETQEVVDAQSRVELINELADCLELMQALSTLHAVPWEEVLIAQQKKREERGGYDERKYVSKAAHPEGSFGEWYCLQTPEKYPEVKDF